MFDLVKLWHDAVMAWQMRRMRADRVFGRQMGRHVRARLQRAQAKRRAAGKAVYQPQ